MLCGMYVGASAEELLPLAAALNAACDEARVRGARMATLLQEGGEQTSTVATLAEIERWTSGAAIEANTAAAIAAADAATCAPPAPTQTGLRASMGLVDDVLLDVFFINDVNRLVWGRDLNTGTEVDPGGRAFSALSLIPFGKVAKLGKVAGLGADAGTAAVKADRVLVEGAGSATRVVRYRPKAADPKWGLTTAHVRKHLTGPGPNSLRQIDPAGNTELWRNYMQDLASRTSVVSHQGDVHDVIGTFPKADGSGTFRFGIRIAARDDGTWDLVTLLTKQ